MTACLVGCKTPCGPRDRLGIGSAQAVPHNLHGSAERGGLMIGADSRIRNQRIPENSDDGHHNGEWKWNDLDIF